MENKIIAPLVHMNGSGYNRLATGLDVALQRLTSALDALCAAAPHARDYYPLGDGVYEQARAQWEAHYAAVLAAHDYVEAVYVKVDEQCPVERR